MQDKHALFTEVFLSRAAVWLSRSSVVEPYDSCQHCCIWFMKTWRKRKQPASLWRSVVSRVFVHWGSGYHLVLSCLLSEWDRESASTGGGLEDTPLLSCSPLALFPAHVRTPLVKEENWWLWPELLWSSAATGGLLTLTGQTPHRGVAWGQDCFPQRSSLQPKAWGGEKGGKGTRFCWFAGWLFLSDCLPASLTRRPSPADFLKRSTESISTRHFPRLTPHFPWRVRKERAKNK